MTISSRIKKVNKSLDRMLIGQYCDVDIHWVCNSIAWLYKYGHINDKQKDYFVDQTLKVFAKSKSKYLK